MKDKMYKYSVIYVRRTLCIIYLLCTRTDAEYGAGILYEGVERGDKRCKINTRTLLADISKWLLPPARSTGLRGFLLRKFYLLSACTERAALLRALRDLLGDAAALVVVAAKADGRAGLFSQCH